MVARRIGFFLLMVSYEELKTIWSLVTIAVGPGDGACIVGASNATLSATGTRKS